MTHSRPDIATSNTSTPALRETTRADWLWMTAAIIGWAIVTMTALSLQPLFGAGVAALGLAALVRAHAARSVYRCVACGHVSAATTVNVFANRQGVARSPDGRRRGWLLLRCLQCGERTRATLLLKTRLPVP